MQSDDSLAAEYIRTEKQVEFVMPGAKKRFARLKRRVRRRRRTEARRNK